MAFLRQQAHFRTDSVVPAAAVTITTYDKAGRFNGALGGLCGADEVPQYVYLEGATSAQVTDGVPVSIAFFGHGLVSLKLKGTGSAGNKITTDASGNFVASNTADDAKLASKDCGVALEDWTDGAETLVNILKGGL